MTSFIAPRSKLFAHLDRLQELQATGSTSAPVSVELFVSCRCGHGCAWCHYAYTHTRGPLAGKVAKPKGAIKSGDLMDKQLAFSVIDQLAAIGVRSVTLSGGGEPTANPHFDDIVEHIAQRGLAVGLYTHGGHINDERAALLKRLATWVYVSLDECTAEAFKANKGVNRFDAVLDGIRLLVAAEGDATIGVGFLIHDGNWKDIHDMVRLGRELGVDYVQFRPTVLYDQDAPGKLVEDAAWVPRAIGKLKAYQCDDFVIADIDRFTGYQRWTGHGYRECRWSALQTVISPNGKVWRCTNRTEHPDALLGDLTVDSFADIWARSGGPCKVDSGCRILCRGHLSNQTLDVVMAEMPHKEFI